MKVVHESVRVRVHDCDHHASANAPTTTRRQQIPTGGIWHTYMMVVSSHSEHTKQVHTQTKGTDEQQLAGIHFRRIEAKMPGQKPQMVCSGDTYIRWIASKTINIEIKMRKIPFANPDSVSILPYPYVNRSLAGQVAITDAISPTAMAIQSNAICIASRAPLSGRKGLEDEVHTV